MDAIEAVSRSVKTLADGTLRLSVDIEPKHAQDAFKLFGSPDVPMALARLTVEASKQRAQAEAIEDKPKGGFLSQWLAMRCNEPEFWEFVEHKMKPFSLLKILKPEECDFFVKDLLRIESKTEIDSDPNVQQRFHSEIRIPYAKWLAGARMAS